MTAWETDDEYISVQAAISLPTPQGTPYRTPSENSRKSRKRSVTPPGKGTSPSRMGNGEKSSKRSSRDVTMDENISILDPRRFTPTLHANLVSEILALRRDQEEKTKLIESLEIALHTSKEEQESLQENVTSTSKEARSLQRQLSLLEGGSSSALSQLARERDEAVESVADARKRLDAAQKKIRSLEDDSQRVHDLWAQEKENWEDERRKYERRIHVAESRLKMVLDEVAAYQTNQINSSGQNGQNGHESEVEESGKENDAASVRTMSMTNSIRFSFANGAGSILANGHSLADELNFDDTDDQTDADGRESALSSPRHRRTFSRESVISKLHHRNQSMESLRRPGSVARGRLFMNQAVLEALEGEDEEDEELQTEGEPEPVRPATPKPTYTDTGIQYSPPPSPKLEPVKLVVPQTPVPLEKVPEKMLELETSPRAGSDIEANQRRKRVSLPLTIEPVNVYQRMVSSSVQTMELPLTPPKTPKSPFYDAMPTPVEDEPPKMVTSSTQTEESTPAPSPILKAPSYLPPPPPPLEIPSINIEPPTSRPATPHSPRLPQHFKHFGCQVNIIMDVEMMHSSCQTEAIQTDKRLALLPPHLQPSSITSRPNSPNPGVGEDDKSFTPLPGNLPPRNPRRLEGGRASIEPPSSPISIPGDDDLPADYLGNDDGPLSHQRSAPMRRPRRYSSLYSGFYSISSDEMDEFGDADVSDSEYRTALSAPRPFATSIRAAKRGSVGTVATSPDQSSSRRSGRNSAAKSITAEMYSSFSLGERELKSGRSSRTYERPPPSLAGPSGRASVMRKAAMIQSGIASHRARSRSPSLIDPRNPPFPIPTRASSRRPSISMSIPSDGRSSPMSGHRRSTSRSFYSINVRRVRSANALPKNQRPRRNGSRSPPLSPSTEAAEDPTLPPLPRNDITTPRNGNKTFRRHRHEFSNNTDLTANTELMSQPSNSQAPGVVEAIAQTMVGEWMFKYVRRRKSFGVPDNGNKDDSSNDRHKRWVWLAPYERAILWSSKQPSSGSALLGKTGRKLTIQSVLDVKDDNPVPKGVTTPVFDRSILILTPQRALKFTASTAERHYLWLTALSFLAHSSQAVPDILNPPELSVTQQPLPDFEMPRPKLRRGGIRDSIRLAKGRSGGPKMDQSSVPSVPSIPSIPSAPSSRMGEVASFRVTEPSVTGSNHTREPSSEAAEPPLIPRFHDRLNQGAHGRKRSNTGSHVPPPLSFRGFSLPVGNTSHHHPANSTANASIGTAGSSDIYQQSQASTNTTWGMTPGSTASSQQGNFFDAIGTVRMEAFISPLAYSQYSEYPDTESEYRYVARRRSKELRRRNSRNRRRDNSSTRYGGRGYDFFGGNKTAGEEDFFREDPFKGF